MHRSSPGEGKELHHTEDCRLSASLATEDVVQGQAVALRERLSESAAAWVDGMTTASITSCKVVVMLMLYR